MEPDCQRDGSIGTAEALRAFDLERTGDWSHLAGVDEAGRGALAGPVVAATVILPRGFYDGAACREAARVMNDSKQLSAGARETAFARVEEAAAADGVRFAAGLGSVEEIAEHNILGATRLAMQRAVTAAVGGADGTGEACFLGAEDDLLARASGLQRIRLLVDGLSLRRFPYLHEGVVKGDGLSLAIAMASIVAKVTRDRLMAQLDGECPGFGFARHKGYGTRAHLEALRAQGPCPLHRRRFLRKLGMEESDAGLPE